MLSEIKDGGESVEGSAVGNLDLVEEHPLGSDTPSPADQRAAMERDHVLACLENVSRV